MVAQLLGRLTVEAEKERKERRGRRSGSLDAFLQKNKKELTGEEEELISRNWS